MRLKNTLLSLLFAISSLILFGQDIHYSMFQMSPLDLNPALAGSFYGTSRIGGIYRTQDVILGSDFGGPTTYNTYSIYLDAPVVRGFREQDWIGLGLGLSNDVVGVGDLTKTYTIQAVSYHIALDKDQKNVFTIGINSGSISNNGKNNFRFEDGILTGGQSVEENFLNTQQGGSGNTGARQGGQADAGFGLLYKGYLDKVSAVRIGLSGKHLFNPFNRIGRGGGVTNSSRTPVTIAAFGEYDRLISPRMRVIPAAVFQNSGQFNTFALQTMVAYYFDPKNDITVYGGLGARTNFFNPVDAVPVYLGFDIGDIQTRFAYDVTISGKNFTNGTLGAFEVSVNYIIKIYKRPKVDPTVFCPRF